VKKRLSEEQRETLQCIARGMGNEQIARELMVAPDTIRSRVRRLFQLLRAQNRAQLVAHAYEEGILRRESEENATLQMRLTIQGLRRKVSELEANAKTGQVELIQRIGLLERSNERLRKANLELGNRASWPDGPPQGLSRRTG
jgi:DNA-binding CsgD family transcriptional regulator